MRVPAILLCILVLSVALAGCTGSTEDPEADHDEDGVPDVLERDGWIITMTREEDPVTYRVTSDPEKIDTDGDELTDYDERMRGTDPRLMDSSGNGLLDGSDLEFDADSAQAQQLRELGIVELPAGSGRFLGSLDRCGEHGLPPLKSTTWTSDYPIPDNISDGEELLGWTVTIRGITMHVTSDPCLHDTDDDDLADHLEKQLGADPRNPDTDGDGVRDGRDADPLHDLGLAFESITTNTTSETDASVAISLGSHREEGVADGELRFLFAVNDTSPSRDSLLANALLVVRDAESEDLVAVTPAGGSAVLAFDLAKATLEVNGREYEEGVVELEGSDGTLSFRWHVTRN